MNLLLIDTSNQPMSIALMNDDEVLAIKTTNSKKDHSSQLMPGIQSLFNESNLKKQELDGIVVAKGPGSYKKLNALNQPYVFVGEDTEKLSELLHGDIETKLPNATVMKHLIHQPENIHTFVPNYIKLSEAERNWLNQQKNS